MAQPLLLAIGMVSSAQPRVTRDVEPATLADLLGHPPRATIAFVRGDVVDVVPARAHFDGEHCRVGVDAGVAPDLVDHEVVLVIDDGQYWFQLRGVSVRGRAMSAPQRDAEGLVWYDVAPRRVLAWDYGRVREA